MLQLLIYDKKLYYTLFFWVFVGVFTGPLVYLIIPAHLLILTSKGEWLIVLLGLWLVMTLSDSRQHVFQFAETLKIILMGLVGYLFLASPKTRYDWDFFKPFIAFFLIASFAWLNSPVALDSIMKMSSYALLLMVIPWLVNKLLTEDRDLFLIHLVMLGTFVLMTGVALKFISPGFVNFIGNRFSGLLGNPNGLGIYGFMFLSMVTIIFTFHPHLFSLKEKIFVYFIILLSLVWASSRGGLFASALFILGWYLFKKNTVTGLIVMSSIFISYQLVLNNFEVIASSLGLQKYFRLETFRSGAGRLVAEEFAWKQINTQYWLGKGFGFSEYFMQLNAGRFLNTEHQGNVHNSYLTIWIDTGLFGLIAFCYGWLNNFFRAARNSPIIWALFFGLILSTSVESWLSASLNPFTIQLVIILSLLSNKEFYQEEEGISDVESVVASD